MKTFRQYLAESNSKYNISKSDNGRYYYIDDGKNVLMDDDGNTLEFSTRGEAEEYILELDESCKGKK